MRLLRYIGNSERVSPSLISLLQISFRLDNHQSTKYKNSPYFKGTVLWDRLPDTTIGLGSLLEFKREIRKCFCPFNESLL